MQLERFYPDIIWSADVPNIRELEEYLDKIGHPITVKLDRDYHRANDNQPTSESSGLLRELGYREFNDAKIIEMPDKVVKIARTEIRMTKPWMLNIMMGALSTMIPGTTLDDEIDAAQRFANVCLDAGVRPCGVTVLTGKTPGTVASEFNERTAIQQVLFYVEIMAEFGYTDIVCSPQEIEAIRADARFNEIDLNTPGIRLPGQAKGQQSRTGTPGGAYRAGGNRVVVGGPITNSDDPRAVVEAIAADMASAAEQEGAR